MKKEIYKEELDTFLLGISNISKITFGLTSEEDEKLFDDLCAVYDRTLKYPDYKNYN